MIYPGEQERQLMMRGLASALAQISHEVHQGVSLLSTPTDGFDGPSPSNQMAGLTDLTRAACGLLTINHLLEPILHAPPCVQDVYPGSRPGGLRVSPGPGAPFVVPGSAGQRPMDRVIPPVSEDEQNAEDLLEIVGQLGEPPSSPAGSAEPDLTLDGDLYEEDETEPEEE